MKMFHILTYLCFSIILIISSNVKSPTYQVGISTGYYNGISWQLQVEVLDFATFFFNGSIGYWPYLFRSG
jgi:hypothetical protein